jgi:O-acetyl-ADP-ribose deacetylase (regulator of RNase III)
MIEKAAGNILEANVEALVNTVNCVGHMGKGIALQFKQAFPDNYAAYAKACRAAELQPGRVHVFRTGMWKNPKFIINFPTKNHWRGKSRYEYVQSGLTSLVAEIRRLRIHSIALPPLGCGLGGLEWSRVRAMIVEALGQEPDLLVQVFEPHGAPDARTMPVRTERPRMTSARALFLKLMQQYVSLAYRLTLLEIQKLAYFLQEAGEPLRLRYEAGHYGPYASNLNKVLEVLEGHYIRGYGDSQKPDAEVELLPGATPEADRFLAQQPESKRRLDQVAELIEGFETPYGMELLASVHWVARRGSSSAASADEAVAMIHQWNERKRVMFQASHILIAWGRLRELGWISRQ